MVSVDGRGRTAGAQDFGRLAPYLERAWRRVATPAASSEPRTVWYRTPGKSLTRPPRISTTECSCRLWPSPGMYAVTSMPLVRRTRATLRSAELGFFGVVVYTRVHTPRFWGAPSVTTVRSFNALCKKRRAGAELFRLTGLRPLRTNC